MSQNSERKRRLEEAQKQSIDDGKRKKLLSQSAEITYKDVVECIKVGTETLKDNPGCRIDKTSRFKVGPHLTNKIDILI